MAERPPLHVLMVLESTYPSPHGGGAEAQVRTLARALRARGQLVTVLTPLMATGPQQRIGRVDGVAVCRLSYPRLRLIGGFVLWCRLILFLWARRRRYDAWHVHIAHHLGAVCALLGRWLGKPVVVKVSGWWELEHGALAANPGVLARIAFHCLRHADAWQAISKRIAAELVKKGIPASRIFAIPNAVDTVRFRKNVRTPGVGPRFVFIGRLVHEKGLDTLLDAFVDTLHRCPDAHLRIVGTGPLESMLKLRATELGIASQVEFSGHREDIETLMADADIGLLTSRIEGLSNTLLECMSAGLPMIASRVSGSEDMVRPGDNGWLFEPGDRGALAACLAEAALLPLERRQWMGARARETVERQAGLDSVLDSLLVLYRGNIETNASVFPIVERGA
jgi:glycosyltransferase involved in cell wall biosynthesis